MKFNRLGTFTLGVVITAVSVGAVSFVNAAGNATVTACADKKTGVMRYIAKGKCKKTETSLSWNQMGPQGLTGTAGTIGTAGVKGDTGAAGTKGDTGAAGSLFSARSICGLDGETLCAVGTRGPGGGTVFYVDTEGKFSDFDYLEFAPEDVGSKDFNGDWSATQNVWSRPVEQCGPSSNTSCQDNSLTGSGEALNYLAIGTGRAGTAAIVARHEGKYLDYRGSYAASLADEYSTATASDWWLPSRDELNEICKYARNTGQAPGGHIKCNGGTFPLTGFGETGGNNLHWSSSERVANAAWSQDFETGMWAHELDSDTTPENFRNRKSSVGLVRAVRGF